MNLRDQIAQALKDAIRAQDNAILPTLRLINAAIKDREIEERGKGNTVPLSDDDLLPILAKMVKQRQESANAYEEGGRIELAEKELQEIKIIKKYMPLPLSEEETKKAILAAIKQAKASSMRDIGKVMGLLKNQYTGQIDFAKASALVREVLS